MINLQNTLFWKQNLGLLPMRLFSSHEEEGSFIMLNGSYGNFCLSTGAEHRNPYVEDRDADDYYSLSWSSNTKNFVVLEESSVRVYNWKKSKTETISRRQIEDNSDRFYEYLARSSYKSENDVVPFIVEIFKQFRNLTQERDVAVEALNLLFLLLVSIKEELNSTTLSRWGLDGAEIPSNFDLYIDRIRSGFANVKPQLDLIIRHSSGILFQEAQKEVLFFDQQPDLWGFYSSKLDTKSSLYSSIHYTPPYLARAIVENAIRALDLNKPSLKIFDPACGSGEFLIEVLKQLKENGYSGNVRIIGWDSSDAAVNTSKFLLNYEQRTVWIQNMSFQVKSVENSLAERWDDDYDLILMNPPFTSWVQMDDSQREAVRQVLSASRPNQASAFFYKSIQSLNHSGVIGCVIPSSLLMLDTYNQLRNDIRDLISINLIAKLGNFVFENALTDASVIIGRKPKENTNPLVLWTKNEAGVAQVALRDLRKMYYSNSLKVVETDYSIYSPVVFPIARTSWKIASFEDSELFKGIERFVLEGSLIRVQSIFNVQQGMRTGSNKVFKITASEYLQLPNSERNYFRAIIDNESIKDGRISKRNYVWYPYDKNEILIHTEGQLKSAVPHFYQIKLLPARNSLINRKDPPVYWWALSRPRPEMANKEPKLVSTEFGNSDSFGFDKEGEFAVERGSAWLPKKEFQDMDYHYFYLAIFSSPFFDNLLSVYSKQLAGGNWYDLGKKYTKDIPIPNVFLEATRSLLAYNQLIEIGKGLSDGNHHLRNLIDTILLKYFYPKAS